MPGNHTGRDRNADHFGSINEMITKPLRVSSRAAVVGRFPTLTITQVAGGLGILAPLIAASIVLVAGWVTPGYDPRVRTISRLAEPGFPFAAAVELAIYLVGVASLALAVALRPGSTLGRALLGIAGVALLVAAAIRLDPASAQATTEHRMATTVAMLALAGAPLAFALSLRRRSGWEAYGRISFAFGVAEVAMLLAGLALLATSFAAWGVWERCFLALPMGWIVLVSARLLSAGNREPMFSSTADNSSWAKNVSADEIMNAAAASHSSTGE
jgi:uncharacterized protein DUF998